MARGGGGTGEPHARGIPWQFRKPNGQPHRAQTGGGQKSRAAPGAAPPSLSPAGFFLCLPIFGRRRDECGRRRAERGPPPGWGLCPIKRRFVSLLRSCQPIPGASGRRVCDHARGGGFAAEYFPVFRTALRELCFEREQWEHGNKLCQTGRELRFQRVRACSQAIGQLWEHGNRNGRSRCRKIRARVATPCPLQPVREGDDGRFPA